MTTSDDGDFDKTVKMITFPADEDFTEGIMQIQAHIPILDDKIYEADEEVFIVYMEVAVAANFHLISDSGDPQNSICIIEDCKCIAIAYYIN